MVASTASGRNRVGGDIIGEMDLINKWEAEVGGKDETKMGIGDVDYEIRSTNVSFPVRIVCAQRVGQVLVFSIVRKLRMRMINELSLTAIDSLNLRVLNQTYVHEKLAISNYYMLSQNLDFVYLKSAYSLFANAVYLV